MVMRRNKVFKNLCENCQMDNRCGTENNCTYGHCRCDYKHLCKDHDGYHIFHGCRCGQDATEKETKKNKCKYYKYDKTIRHAHWIGGEIGHCSYCGHEGCASDIWNGVKGFGFCPNCGAKMDEEGEGK